jgi:S1-C subfamily serine protease
MEARMNGSTRFKVLTGFLWGMACLLTVSFAAAADQELRMTPVVRAVQDASPAVVNIKASKVVQRGSSPFQGFFEDFSPFFRDIFPSQPRQYVRRSLGSGVVIDGRKRFVLTNAHVISGASNIQVRLLDGREFEAELVGSEPDFDLALLKLSGGGSLPEASTGSSEDLLIGESVIAIGNPYGFSHTVTTGVISALNRTIETEHGTYMGFVQTDAAINPGNSGGPLLNIYGRVIGINTAIYAKAQGIGFAIPIDKAKRVVDELVSFGKVHPVWLGVSGQNVDQRIAGYFGLDKVSGMLVTEVYEDTPAAEKGLRPGDILISIGGTDIQDKEHYQRLIRNWTQKAQLDIAYLREGKNRKLTMAPDVFDPELALELARKRWGLAVREGGESLVIQEVVPNTPAESLGLQRGDRIYKIAGRGARTREDFVQSFMRYRMQSSVLLLVARQGQGYYVHLRM